MAKKKNNKQKNQVELDTLDTGFKASAKGVIGTIIGVLLVFGCFYLLTLHMTSKGERKQIGPASIGYEKILAGSIFDTGEKDYLVVFYDREKETDITNAVSIYNTKHDVHIFYVDLADGLNKKVISDRMNTNVKDAKIQ